MRAWVEDTVTLLVDAREQIEAAEALHDEALDNHRVRRRFKARIKSIIEHERSALDYLAVGLTEEFGTPKGLIYYPLAQSDKEFPSVMESRMPGVAAGEPAIAAMIQRHQPYQPYHEPLRDLNRLTREQKHNKLTLQIVRETFKCRVTEKSTGAYVQWQGVRFEPGQIIFESGTIETRPEPNRDPAAPVPLELGGPMGVMIFGVPVNPETQRPFPNVRLDIQSGPLHRWWFMDPHLPVLDELHLFDLMVSDIVKDVLQVAFP